MRHTARKHAELVNRSSYFFSAIVIQQKLFRLAFGAFQTKSGCSKAVQARQATALKVAGEHGSKSAMKALRASPTRNTRRASPLRARAQPTFPSLTKSCCRQHRKRLRSTIWKIKQALMRAGTDSKAFSQNAPRR